VQQLLNILQNTKSKVNLISNSAGEVSTQPSFKSKNFIHCWILDTGVTDHVTFTKELFPSFY